MTRESIRSSVSREEMLHLREQEGLTNKEIADYCGISVSSVLNYIGKQGFRKPVIKEEKKEEPKKVMDTPTTDKRLSVLEQTLKGSIATYVLAPEQKTISIKGQTEGSMVEAIITFTEAIIFAEELQEAIMKLTTL